ncbi:MAG: D-aminopeptidase [Kosmotogales bacterium]|nr:D-aminopeptidase [Kosmotogales bacterium]
MMNSQKRISDFDIRIGSMKRGKLNKITDVKGVKVGHYTVDNENNKTGITFINPTSNIFENKLIAASHVINGFGKTTGLIQVDELGQLESPIVLTNTLSVGLVQNFLVNYTIDECEKKNIEVKTFNPVVAECNDGFLNNIRNICFEYNDFIKAVSDAKTDFLEGDIGSGKGMSCHGLKGGIGSASRMFKIDEHNYTLGVLVLSNHASLKDLTINGVGAGKKIIEKIECMEQEDKGSIIVIFATDLPTTSRQLKRISKRAIIGINRLGSYMGNGSGEIVIGFSTAVNLNSEKSIQEIKIINESKIDPAFRAIAEATEEAILNSMITASKVVGYRGNIRYSLRDFIHLFT